RRGLVRRRVLRLHLGDGIGSPAARDERRRQHQPDVLLHFSSPFSIASTSVLSTFTLAKSLSSASTSVQGAISVLVRSTMSHAARPYASHLERLRQSSSVILKRLNALPSRSRKRRSCSSWLTWSQSLTRTKRCRASCSSKSLISVYARIQSASEAKPSTRSTSTRPYHDRSNIPSIPRPGMWRQKRQR